MTAALIVILGMLTGFGIMSLIKWWFNRSLPVIPEPEREVTVADLFDYYWRLAHDSEPLGKIKDDRGH